MLKSVRRNQFQPGNCLPRRRGATLFLEWTSFKIVPPDDLMYRRITATYISACALQKPWILMVGSSPSVLLQNRTERKELALISSEKLMQKGRRVSHVISDCLFKTKFESNFFLHKF